INHSFGFVHDCIWFFDLKTITYGLWPYDIELCLITLHPKLNVFYPFLENDSLYEETEKKDGISLIATFIGKPIMLDSYTSSMCNDLCGQSSFTWCLIGVNSEADLVDVVTVGVPSLTGECFTKETICVEYEWRPPRLMMVFKRWEKRRRKKVAKSATNGNASKSSSMLKTADIFSKKDNVTTSNSFSSLNDEEENEDKNVENVCDESANLFTNTKTSGSLSITAAAGLLVQGDHAMDVTTPDRAVTAQ
nr:zinc knuckle CX2CX4HX4C [Tanacetum cinerariifolium]